MAWPCSTEILGESERDTWELYKIGGLNSGFLHEGPIMSGPCYVPLIFGKLPLGPPKYVK